MRARFISEKFNVLKGPTDEEVKKAMEAVTDFYTFSEMVYDIEDLNQNQILIAIKNIVNSLDNIYSFADAKFEFLSPEGEFGWARDKVNLDINKMISNNTGIPESEFPDDDLNFYAFILENFKWRWMFYDIEIKNDELHWKVDGHGLDEHWIYANKEIVKIVRQEEVYIATHIMNVEYFLYAIAGINEVEWEKFDKLD